MGSLVRFLLFTSLFLALCRGMPSDKKDSSIEELKEKEEDKNEISGGGEKVGWQTKETKDEHSLDKCDKDQDCRHVSQIL